MKMLQSLAAAFRLPDLRKRMIFLAIAIAVFTLGRHIPLPGIDRKAMAELFSRGDILNLLDVFSGGALKQFSILALGIMPYINASIIFQLLTIAWPHIQELAKEGEHGRKIISKWTRYLTIGLAIFQALGLTMWLKNTDPPVLTANWFLWVKIMLSLAAGTAFLMWLGEQITEKGIGNGVSLIIFAGIMARFPQDVFQTITWMAAGAGQVHQVLFLVVILVGTIIGIIYIQQGERKIPVQHAKRVVGNRMMGGSSSFLPMKVNQAGVIPIIFAISVAMFPATIASFIPADPNSWLGDKLVWVKTNLMPGSSNWALALYFLLVIGFTYFYTAVTFDPVEVADNMKKWGSFVPGIRPGRATADYLDRVLVRITFAGAIFLGVIALLQYLVPDITGVQTFSLVGGTSLLIVVGVALETMQQLEAHLLMRHYEGFIR